MQKRSILLYPKVTEKTSKLIETENKIVFVVDKDATKDLIKREFERKFSVKVEKVNLNRTFSGEKIAYIKLKEGGKAQEVATKLKIL
ncbi:MAG: 50S ribosomal protein L23 [Thaumarchaeota archaeon]|jgi:large subunit ribosomal protein L23|nr:50S ribosomal protein L23 [Nitrososphaerota archaeon]